MKSSEAEEAKVELKDAKARLVKVQTELVKFKADFLAAAKGEFDNVECAFSILWGTYPVPISSSLWWTASCIALPRMRTWRKCLFRIEIIFNFFCYILSAPSPFLCTLARRP